MPGRITPSHDGVAKGRSRYFCRIIDRARCNYQSAFHKPRGPVHWFHIRLWMRFPPCTSPKWRVADIRLRRHRASGNVWSESQRPGYPPTEYRRENSRALWAWWGNFTKEPLAYEDIPFLRILEPDFLFREQVFYRVSAENVPAQEP